MLRDLLLASGLLLSTASQLRLAGLPVGPGELFLLTWVLLMLGREAARLGPPITPPLTVLVMFWAAFAVAQSIGTMTGYVIGDVHDPSLFRHDIMAYALLAIVSCLLVVGPGAGPHLHRVSWLLVSLGAGFLLIQVAGGFDVIDIGTIDPWYWERFRGWSSNANQLALLCVVLALLSLHLAEVASRTGERIAAIACAIVPVYVGRLSMSDSFALVLLFSVPIFLALKLRTWTREGRPTFRSAFAWIVILALPAVVVSVVPLVNSIAVEAKDIAKEITRGEDADTERSASIRFAIWGDAIDRGLESAMLGLGPGPHLENPFRIGMGPLSEEARKNPTTPQPSSLPNFEAHNTLLDLFMQSGLLGILSVVGLGAMTLAGTCRAKLDGLTTLLCGLAIFSCFHLIVRHPIFWFAIAVCLVAGDAVRRAPYRRTWS
ncbi:O-antigen ligase family protein [Flaviflagellibacter deserti]|uniref:O-antigen ligase family protein n=1 Tax=Flaviflagellibacter deserti TaxID=2267266 RepID=A0ABV9Z0Q7_9HYPH